MPKKRMWLTQDEDGEYCLHEGKKLYCSSYGGIWEGGYMLISFGYSEFEHIFGKPFPRPGKDAIREVKEIKFVFVKEGKK